MVLSEVKRGVKIGPDFNENLSARRSLTEAGVGCPMMEALRTRFVDALISGDPAVARRLIDEALSDSADVRALYLDVFQPALYEIGRRWSVAELSVAQEHLATATTQTLMARLSERLGAGSRRRGRTAIVACPEGEQHAVGGRMVADFLESDGWDVRFVGAVTPAAGLAALASEHGAEVVALSAALPARVGEVRAAAAALKALSPAPLVAVGGQAFGGDARRALSTGADLYAADAREFLRVLEARL
jgi:MerR family transcriptional regulator, light-induced transcriptional regulator